MIDRIEGLRNLTWAGTLRILRNGSELGSSPSCRGIAVRLSLAEVVPDYDGELPGQCGYGQIVSALTPYPFCAETQPTRNSRNSGALQAGTIVDLGLSRAPWLT